MSDNFPYLFLHNISNRKLNQKSEMYKFLQLSTYICSVQCANIIIASQYAKYQIDALF